MLIRAHHGVHPRIPDTAFVAETAVVIGDVTLGEDSSLWYGVILRGDVHSIAIGDRTNIQDGSIVHVTRDRFATRIASDVVVGHRVLIHGATIHERCLIGMGAILLDDCEIGHESIVAAGSLVPPGMKVPPRSLVMGRPARRLRSVEDAEVTDLILAGVSNYVAYARDYRLGG